ncbi:MAG: hypothetical protein ACOYXC_01470 [Candidatus Rifleibacteriota bacterium]
MNGKHIFCFSLIILSVVMGLHWFKNKPKPKKKVSDRPRVALNLDDLQIQDEDPDGKKPVKDPENPDEPEENPENQGDPNDPDSSTGKDPDSKDPKDPDQGDNPEVATASGTVPVTDNASAAIDIPPELNDPIILAVKAIPRNPFEPSPYAQLVEKLRELEEKPDEEEIKKVTELLRANFTATIKTRKELVAVIDSRLYRKGDLFQNREITDIGAELVSLDTESKLFLIPKVGVEVSIASDGTYTFEDSYKKN